MAFYQRCLPHWQPLGQPLFVTWRLHGSLPSHRVFPADSLTSGQAFAAMDRLLDQAGTGPRYLSQPAIARLVVEALHYGQASLRHYTLHAFVVMTNHVHLLITPQVALPKLLRSLKGITAKRPNQILGLTGQAFWQEEGYDRWVRDGKEFDRLRAYIEQNPVRAGLVKAPEHYPWSSATKEQAGQGAPRPRGAAPLHLFTDAGGNVETPEILERARPQPTIHNPYFFLPPFGAAAVLRAVTVISTLAGPARPATPTVVRVGRGSLK